MTTRRAEKFRKPHPMGFEHSHGDDFGWFEVPSNNIGKQTLYVMVAPGDCKWQHISVSKKKSCPTWSEMCQVKDLFFDSEDVVVQFHPRKSEYVNMAKNCLHLWRLNDGSEFPTPESYLVGL